ncbi:hypothetical protein MFMK1_000033 [Metallumcola ferriviriculae]|uniref:Uncharacterized protein n=1 Tax=Metallumcola ferriviriculae TaxID=3039180 RepID=A0AAU0UGY9_9FIRM|nr:hypothetical protein MFMK1_000033 [Desulfitibacteraceae bacterium MK1]
MALNNIARNSVRLMQELTTMPFRAAQDIWAGSNDEQSSTAGRNINRSLGIMEQLTSMPFQVALDLLEPNGRSQKQQQTSSEPHMQSQLYGEDREFHQNFPPQSKQ